MSEFDPYYKWLGIKPHDQPPNHYRLLGIDLFEDDIEVIQATFSRQRMHLMTYRSGQHGPLAQQLLQEITAAKTCLLDPAMKQAYDAALQDGGAETAESPEADYSAEPLASETRSSSQRNRAPSRQEIRAKRAAEPAEERLWLGLGKNGQIGVVGGGVLLMLLMVLYMAFAPKSSAKPQKATQKQDEPLSFPSKFKPLKKN